MSSHLVARISNGENTFGYIEWLGSNVALSLFVYMIGVGRIVSKCVKRKPILGYRYDEVKSRERFVLSF